MRLSPTAIVFAVACIVFSAGAAGADAGSNDPGGKVLLVWVWLLPVSGVLALSAYLVAATQVNRSFAAAAARRKLRNQ